MDNNPIRSVNLLDGNVLEGKFPFELLVNYLGNEKKIQGSYEINNFGDEEFKIDTRFAQYVGPYYNNIIKSSIKNLVTDFTKNSLS